MKAVMISINKPHTNNIFAGDKSLEWRKKPLPEGLCYVYETKNKGGCGMVIGEMYITGSRAVDTSGPLDVWMVNAGCVHPVNLKKYANNGTVYANFIKEAKRYENPRMLGEFHFPADRFCEKGLCGGCPYEESPDVNGEYMYGCDWERPVLRPPQSWCYVEELKDVK